MSCGILVQGFKMPNSFDEHKTISLGKWWKRCNSLKTFSLYLNFLINLFWSLSKASLNLMSNGILFQDFKIPNLVDEYKTIFLGKWGKRWNSPKTFSLYLSFREIFFEVCRKPISSLMSYEILVQGFEIPNLIHEYKTIFLEKRRKHWNVLKTFSLNLNFL